MECNLIICITTPDDSISSMTFEMNGRQLKEKWLKQYQEEISTHRNQKEKEKAIKLQEEQDYLNKIKRELQEEESKKFDKKKKIENDYINDYNRMINEKKRNKETKPNVDNVSLELNSEDRIKDLKNYINKLSEKVDINMNHYVEYQKNLKHFADTIENPLSLMSNSPKVEVNVEDDNKKKKLVTDINNLNDNNCNSQQISNNYSNSPCNRLDFISNRNFIQYKEVLREYNNYNKSIILNKFKSNEDFNNQKKKLNEERLKELENMKKMKIVGKQNLEKTQSIYRELLEDQIKSKLTPIPNSYGKDFFILNKNDHGYDSLLRSVPTIKPYSLNRRYDLGETVLEVNTILNPVHDYKHNKYLFKNNKLDYFDKYSFENDINIKPQASALQMAGHSIIK